ncbi:MAG TPA: hypothetical protein VFG14_00505 [Chthoniobacteraceae bacterium]|nr:hypothetical protein [Chthoniobacteraceae bacterium]
MKARALKLTALFAGLAVFGGIVYLARDSVVAPSKVEQLGSASPSPAVSIAGTPTAKSNDVIEDFLVRLQQRRVTLAQMLEFRQTLLEGDPAKSIVAIRAFLATGKDVSTGLTFELGEGGNLDRAPTLRLLLLDLLGQLSRKAKTADASAVSKEILAEKKSSDEWAIALRNVAWTEPQSQSYLAAKFAEMARHEPWRTRPGAGFLEAFDVAVYSREVSVLQPLGELLQQPETELQRAAAMALDRLAALAPLEVMQQLNAQPGMFADSPFLRADWFSKADLRDPAQRAAFETYLARGDVAMDEKSKAIKALAAPGEFISDNLLTPPPAPADDSARDAAVLTAAKDWGTRFPELSAPLTILRERLGP